MKYTLRFLAVVSALLLWACHSDNTSDAVYGDDANSLEVSLPSTRTALGDKSGDTYPLFWSEGDKIAVNGAESDSAVVDAESAAKAVFTFNSTISYPYNITYPYHSTTTASSSRVLFPAEQSYTEGTFAEGSAPMCGYAASAGAKITLKHLAGVVKFPLSSKADGVVLSKIVISSPSAKLSGEFVVNCQNATIIPSSNSQSSVTYHLPANFELPTTSVCDCYISLPSVDAGNCTVEFITATGEKMVKSWSASRIKAGIVREFKTIYYETGATGSLQSFDVMEDTLISDLAYGYVKDSAGNPIVGVAVSDGFSVVQTDETGLYQIKVTSDTWYIYISLPSEYEVPINEYGQPCFYKKYYSAVHRYDFTLTPLASGKESKFALFTFADPQVTNSTNLGRFKTTIPLVKAYVTEVSSTGLPCYGITLGDILSNSSTNNDDAYRDNMRDEFAASKVGMPVFQVMGNHDCCYYTPNNPIFADETSSTYNLKAQRAHEDMFGPVNYSFNRGDVHIVAMRDIVYKSNTTSSNDVGFLPAQVEWLKRDLALVPKDKLLLLCVHIQLLNRTPNYTQDVLKMLNEFNEVHVLSGHTHIQHNYIHKYEGSPYTNIYEHNTCALCGPWWHAKVAGDGSPSGYNVFVANGNTLVDWYYMGYNAAAGENRRSHQMRLYRGNAAYGADAPTDAASNPYGIKGYYGFNYGDDYILANVYNADNDWVIKVYEDGVYTGDMTSLAYNKPSISSLIGSYTKADPRRAADGVLATAEFFVAGLRLGLLGSWSAPTDSSPNGEPGSAAYGATYHMYRYKLKNKNASVKVVAIDRFGNQYTETKFADNGALDSYRW